MTSQKYLFALWHKADKGKTQTMHALATLLHEQSGVETLYSTYTEHKTRDFVLIIRIGGKIIMIVSQGDPTTEVYERIKKLYKNYRPDTIYCTTRTYGQTVDDVDKFAEEFGFEVVWTSTYQIGNIMLQDKLNKAKARDLWNLLSVLSD